MSEKSVTWLFVTSIAVDDVFRTDTAAIFFLDQIFFTILRNQPLKLPDGHNFALTLGVTSDRLRGKRRRLSAKYFCNRSDSARNGFYG